MFDLKQELNYQEAKSLASNIQTSSNAINDILNRSDSAVKTVQANWEGVSADYAIDDWNSWKKDFEEYYQMLIQNVKNIDNACNDFAETEARMQQNYQQ